MTQWLKFHDLLWIPISRLAWSLYEYVALWGGGGGGGGGGGLPMVLLQLKQSLELFLK